MDKTHRCDEGLGSPSEHYGPTSAETLELTDGVEEGAMVAPESPSLAAMSPQRIMSAYFFALTDCAGSKTFFERILMWIAWRLRGSAHMFQ